MFLVCWLSILFIKKFAIYYWCERRRQSTRARYSQLGKKKKICCLVSVYSGLAAISSMFSVDLDFMNEYWTEGTMFFWEIISWCSNTLIQQLSMCWNVLYSDNHSGYIEDFIIVRFLVLWGRAVNLKYNYLVALFVLIVCFPLYITLLLFSPTFCWKSISFFKFPYLFYISLINGEVKEYWKCWIIVYCILSLQ